MMQNFDDEQPTGNYLSLPSASILPPTETVDKNYLLNKPSK
jgi:hypothetical protein